MPGFDRIVVDTNVFVSALMILGSVPSQAVGKVLDSGTLLFSEAMMTELAEVLSRPKFGRYVSVERRASLLGQLSSIAEFVPIIRLVRECRDPRDDKFLDVALN